MLDTHTKRRQPTAVDIILSSQNGVSCCGIIGKNIGNRVVSIRDNKIVDDDIKEALSMPKKFNQKLYDLL